MKKILLFAWGLYALAPLQIAVGQTGSVTDTLVVNHPKRVTIISGEKAHTIRVEGKNNDPNYYYQKTIEQNSTSSSVTREYQSSWDFKIPFTGSTQRKKSKNEKDFKFQVQNGGIAFGFVNALNAPAPMDVKMGASYEIMSDHIINFAWYPSRTRRTVCFFIGVGIDWRNYRMTGNTRFLKEGANLTFAPYPEGADVLFSRLKIFSWTIPIMYNQRLSKDLTFSFGPVVNFNTYGSLKTHYKLNGRTEKILDKNIHQNPVTVDLMAHLKIKIIGFYVKYAPCNIVDTEYGPKFNSLSTGITLWY